MKFQFTVMLLAGTLSFSALSAQLISNDSMSVLKNDKESMKIQQSINEKKIELAKLENKLAEKTGSLHTANEKAQEAAETGGHDIQRRTSFGDRFFRGLRDSASRDSGRARQPG